jgi:multidrug efflux pump subunit AcrB
MGRSSRTALSIAFVVMFFLIALSFRSYLQAAVVFSLIPLGVIGAVWGHWANGMPFNIMSAYGLLALIGIIVNDSIVYTNTFNGYLKKGMSFKDSIFKAGINRFRPILLTTLKTDLGLLRLLAEKSLQAQFLIPMAISVAYGLMFASVCILIVLPVFLMFLNKTRVLAKWLWVGERPTEEEVEPAIKEEKTIRELSA